MHFSFFSRTVKQGEILPLPLILCGIHTHKGPTSNAAGPAATVSSVTVVLQPVSTTYVWPEMGAVPLGAVGTVRVKPPSTAVALWNGLIGVL